MVLYRAAPAAQQSLYALLDNWNFSTYARILMLDRVLARAEGTAYTELLCRKNRLEQRARRFRQLQYEIKHS